MIRRWRALLSQHWELPVLLGTALLIRLYGVDTRGLQYDDTFSIFLSNRSLPEIIRGTAADTMPPLYYFILHFWGKLSQAVWSLRLPSIFFSVLAVFLLYRWIYILSRDRRAAFGAALLMVVSPFQFYHAQDVRNYSMLLSAQLGYMLFFTKIWLNDESGAKTQKSTWTGFVLCGLAAMYIHNVAVLALILPDFFLLLTKKFHLLKRIILAQLIILTFSIPWLFQLPGQVTKVQRAWWMWSPGIIDIFQIPIVWSAGLPLPGWLIYAGAVLGIVILVMILLESWRYRKDSPSLLLFLTILGLPVVFFAISYLMRPIFVPRGFILSSAAYLGLAGWMARKSWSRGPGKVILGLLLAAALIGIPSQITYASFPRSPFEKAADELSKIVQPGDVILHENKLSAFPMRFYHPELRQEFLADIPESGNDTFARESQEAMQIFPAKDLETAVSGARGVYFVVFIQSINDYQHLGIDPHPVMAWLEDRFSLETHLIYNDLEIYYYVQP